MLNIVRSRLLRFSDNAILIQFFAALSSIRLFVDNSRGRIQTMVEQLSLVEVNTDSAIQEAGEDLSTLLGLTLEAKMVQPKNLTNVSEDIGALLSVRSV